MLEIDLIKKTEAEAWERAKAWAELNVPGNATEKERSQYAIGFTNGVFYAMAQLRKVNHLPKLDHAKEYPYPVWVEAGLKPQS